MPTRSRAAAFVTGMVSCLLMPRSADAQPYAWVIATPRSTPAPVELVVHNLASGERIPVATPPAGVDLTIGTLSQDGADYFVSTSAGVARFRTDTRQFEELFGRGTSVVLAASSGKIHVLDSGVHAILDRATGAVLSQRNVAQRFTIVLSRNGNTRFEIEQVTGAPTAVVRAYDEQTNVLLWETSIAGSLSGATAHANVATDHDLVIGVAHDAVRQLAILSTDTGAERGRLDLAAEHLACCRGNTVYASLAVSDALRLVAIDLSSLTSAVVHEIPASVGYNFAGEVMVAPDGSTAYWITTSGITPSFWTASYRAVNLATGDVEILGSLSYFDRLTRSIALLPALPCRFDLPTTASIGPAGGVVEIPVTPIGTCDPWTVSVPIYRGLLNSGPHDGPATFGIVVPANAGGTPRSVDVTALNHTIRIAQAAAAPSTPAARVAVRDRRATLSWTISPGAAPLEFVVRGAAQGGTPNVLATLPAATRTWTSDPLPAGSYELEIVARNSAGDSAPSNRVRFSVGVDTAAEAPLNLAATVRDDVVSLNWSAPAGGPGPAGYVVEAAAGASSVFAPVLQVDSPEAFAQRVPAGTWQVRVRALTTAGAGLPSNVVSVTTSPCTMPPSAPTSLQVMTIADTVTLAWTPPAAGGAEQYVIEGGPANTPAARVQIAISGAAPLYEVRAPYGVYSIRVRARNACGDSAPSNEAFAWTFAP